MDQSKNTEPKKTEREFTIRMTRKEVCEYIERIAKETERRAASGEKLRGGRKVCSTAVCV